MESAAVATGDAAGYMYGVARKPRSQARSRCAGRRCARTWKSWPAPLNLLTPIFEQDLCCLCRAAVVLVFDRFTGVQVMTMHGTSAHRFSYDGNPRWESPIARC